MSLETSNLFSSNKEVNKIDYNKKYSKGKLFQMDLIDAYKIVLYGKYNKSFPNNYWDRPDSLECSGKIIRQFIECNLCLDEDGIKNPFNAELIRSNKLSGMLKQVFKNSPTQAIETAYPNKFKPWEFSSVPRSYWNVRLGLKQLDG